MSDLRLNGELRTEFGKGYARRARAAGHIPAVIYGHGEAPLHVTLPERETARAVRQANALLTITVDGEDHMALVKDVQRDPVLQIIEHIDLLTVRRGQKVQVDIPVHIIDEPAAGAAFTQVENTVSVEAEATHLPSGVEFSIEGREVGAHVLASDLVLGNGVELLTDPETTIVTIHEPETQDLGEEDEAAAEGEATEAAAEAAEESAE